MIILDTDVCLSLLKGSSKLSELYSNATEEICVTAITAQELFFAANRSADPVGNKILAEKFLLTVRILHPDLAALKYAADVQNSLRKAGKQASFSDLAIYSISRAYGAKLITTQGKRYCFT